MQLEIYKHGDNIKIEFPNTNREYVFTEEPKYDGEISTKQKMSLIDVLQTIYMEGKEGRPLIILQKEKESESER